MSREITIQFDIVVTTPLYYERVLPCYIEQYQYGGGCRTRINVDGMEVEFVELGRDDWLGLDEMPKAEAAILARKRATQAIINNWYKRLGGS